MLLLRPDLEDAELQSAVERVTRAVVNGGGTLTKISPWGKRRMAYPIKHYRDASYYLLHFDIEPAAIREIERGLLISEELLRHLVTVLEVRAGTDETDLSPPDEITELGGAVEAAEDEIADVVFDDDEESAAVAVDA
jgi:small subunit ribosomal protein S6